MGDRSRFSRSSGLRLLLRLLSVVASLFVLSVTQRAFAATTGSTPVPMCGEHNESIEAPPIFRPTASGELRNCQAPDQLERGQQAPLAPERVLVPERPERALGFASLFIVQAESARLHIDAAAQLPVQNAFVATPFRPPRA
jgi:hypothetical protein